MFSLLLLLALTATPRAADEPTFAKPSEAYAYAIQPEKEWEAAVREGRQPAIAEPITEKQKRARSLCPAFRMDDQSGDELYFLAALCLEGRDTRKAEIAAQRYLRGESPHYGPEARLVLVNCRILEARPNDAWETVRVMLQRDPVGGEQDAAIRSVLDCEADDSEATALQWSGERYALLKQRFERRSTDVSADAVRAAVSAGDVVLAGADLVHRLYLAGDDKEARKRVDELNGIAQAHPEGVRGWAAEALRWANLEMKRAPALPVVRLFGKKGESFKRGGRVEVISFFFVGCGPCMEELPRLNALQKHYEKSVLVAGVTSYEQNSQAGLKSNAETDAAVEKVRSDLAPDVTMLITTDEAIASYGVHGFPILAVIDKAGRVRWITRDASDEERVERMVLQLVEE